MTANRVRTKIYCGQSGQVLVETMVALAMVVIGLLGLLSLLSYSIGLNKVISDQYVATYLASEGMEVIKNIEDNNVAAGQPYNANLSTNPGSYEVDYNSTQPTPTSQASLHYLLFDPVTKSYNYTSGNPTTFKRQIVILSSDDVSLVVQSTVTWVTRGGISNTITLEDHFYNWRQ